MKLTEMYEKSMKEVIGECDIISQKVYADDNGNIEAIEIKYRPRPKDKVGSVKVPSFLNNGGH